MTNDLKQKLLDFLAEHRNHISRRLDQATSELLNTTLEGKTDVKLVGDVRYWQGHKHVLEALAKSLDDQLPEVTCED